MSAEGPPDNAESRWNRAASNLPPKGLVIKVLVVGTVVAIVLLGLSAWSAFDAMKRISDEYGRLAIIANTVENCDTEELSTEASGTSLAMPSMESGQVPLAELLAKFEDGNKLLKVCEIRLKDAELRIEQLAKQKDAFTSFAATEAPREA